MAVCVDGGVSGVVNGAYTMGVWWNHSKMPKRWSRPRPRRLPKLDKALSWRLMEKPGAASSPRLGQQQDGGAGSDRGSEQHRQYIRRLVHLRDTLITQEQTALARALDRLRLSSISNRDAARYRLKLKEPGGDSPRVGMPAIPGSTTTTRPMMTTVEKFRQMRPQRRQPVIFPLQGRQIVDSPSTGTVSTTRSWAEGDGGTNNSTNNSSSSSSSDSPTGRVRGGVEDTVRSNLQRLMQPTSSIPNIGRKALRPHAQSQVLELRPHQLQNVRGRVLRTRRPHLVSPFMLQPQYHDQDSARGGGSISVEADSREDSEGEDFSPHCHLAYQLGAMTDGDRLDMDKLNQYYYSYCLPDNPATTDGDQQGGTFSQSPGTKPDKPSPRRTHSERPHYPEKTHIARPYSDRGSFGSVVMSSDRGGDLDPPYRYSLHGGGREKVSLPVIHTASSTRPTSSSHKVKREAFLPQAETHPPPPPSPVLEPRKRHIVIDMPHIIFSSATPDVTREPTAVEAFPDLPAGGGGGVGKALTQSEIRQREIHGLLGDVPELNPRTDGIHTHTQGPELDASPGVC